MGAGYCTPHKTEKVSLFLSNNLFFKVYLWKIFVLFFLTICSSRASPGADTGTVLEISSVRDARQFQNSLLFIISLKESM